MTEESQLKIGKVIITKDDKSDNSVHSVEHSEGGSKSFLNKYDLIDIIKFLGVEEFVLRKLSEDEPNDSEPLPQNIVIEPVEVKSD
jgi:hypothetical protein